MTSPGARVRVPPSRGPTLVVHTGDGDVAVAPSATPGGLACLYQAYCTGCGAVYPCPFRIPPAPGHRAAA